MPDESEVIQADIGAEFRLAPHVPHPQCAGEHKTLRGQPVPFLAARKIMASFSLYDKTGDYDGILVPALEQFSEVTGLTDAQITALCPVLTLGGLTGAIQGFFFQSLPILANGGQAKAPDSTKPRAGEPGA